MTGWTPQARIAAEQARTMKSGAASSASPSSPQAGTAVPHMGPATAPPNSTPIPRGKIGQDANAIPKPKPMQAVPMPKVPVTIGKSAHAQAAHSATVKTATVHVGKGVGSKGVKAQAQTAAHAHVRSGGQVKVGTSHPRTGTFSGAHPKAAKKL